MTFSHENLTTDEDMEEFRSGITLTMVAQAISTWARMQDKDCTVADASKAFNATAKLVCDAVNLNPYAALRHEFEPDPAKQFIELEGV